jgi:copper chaperone NosL
MVIDDERTAAAARTADGRELRFDDAGDLVAFVRESAEPVHEGWVRDWNGGGWLRCEAASFVRSTGLATPMGSGLAAFATREAAQRFARERGGEVLTWSDLKPDAGTQ